LIGLVLGTSAISPVLFAPSILNISSRTFFPILASYLTTSPFLKSNQNLSIKFPE
jgi:hypothetical protein